MKYKPVKVVHDNYDSRDPNDTTDNRFNVIVFRGRDELEVSENVRDRRKKV